VEPNANSTASTLFDSIPVATVLDNALGSSVIRHFEYPRLPSLTIVSQANERMATVMLEFGHRLFPKRTMR
jgi:hypothetical protein